MRIIKRMLVAGLLTTAVIGLSGVLAPTTALAVPIGCNSVQENGSGWDGANGEVNDIGTPKQGTGLGSIEQPNPPGNPEGCFGTDGPKLEQSPDDGPSPDPVQPTGVKSPRATGVATMSR